jgi:type IV secretory pathway VirB10-like protein
MNKRTIEGLLDLFAVRRDAPGAADAGTSDRAAPLRPPAPPLAKRLNRNALTVAAVLMGMTVLTSVVVLNTGNGAGSANAAPIQAAAPVATPPEPTFLDRPVTAAPDPRAPRSMTEAGQNPGIPWDVHSAGTGGLPSGSGGVEHSRQREYREALRQSAVVATSDNTKPAEPVSISTAPTPSRDDTGDAESRFLAYSDSVMQSSIRAATGGGAYGGGAPPLSGARRAFLRDAGDAGGRAVIARLEAAGSPYTIRAGTVIPGILLTAITSDLPGECLGQVSRDVYDSKTQRILLLPKGSKLICRYDDQVAAGQGRLLVAWTRLIFPDGRSMTLPGLALKDAQGQTGAVGNVDNHMARVFGNALLLSAIGAGAQLSQPRQASIFAAPTAGQVAAGAAGQELSNVAVEILRRGMDQAPTITIPQGAAFNVFLNGDLVFDGPYVPEP